MCELLRANLYEFQRHQREHGDAPYFTPRRLQAVARQVEKGRDAAHVAVEMALLLEALA